MKIVEGVLTCSDSASVEKVIYEIMQEKINDGISLKRIMYTIPTLESDMRFHIRLKRNQQELKNLIEALRVFREGILINDTIQNID
jgi:hypothetical protein